MVLSLVTLNKYLNGLRNESSAAVHEAQSSAYQDFAARTLAAIGASVFCSESFSDLVVEVDAIRSQLQISGEPETVSRCGERVREALEAYQGRLRQSDSERATDLRNVLNMLNEGLSFLTEDAQTAGVRYQELESNLAAACRMDDIRVLRQHLAKTLETVREEARAGEARAAHVINSMGRQIQQVHKAQVRFNSNLPGRSEALEYIGPILKGSAPATNFYIALFVADSLPAIRERHGEEIGTFILQEMGRKQVQALAPDGKVFCWSASALLLTWNHTDASQEPKDVPAQFRTPCEQRACVGSRVAIFNVAVRWLLVHAQGSVEELITFLDRFHQQDGMQ